MLLAGASSTNFFPFAFFFRPTSSYRLWFAGKIPSQLMINHLINSNRSRHLSTTSQHHRHRTTRHQLPLPLPLACVPFSVRFDLVVSKIHNLCLHSLFGSSSLLVLLSSMSLHTPGDSNHVLSSLKITGAIIDQVGRSALRTMRSSRRTRSNGSRTTRTRSGTRLAPPDPPCKIHQIGDHSGKVRMRTVDSQITHFFSLLLFSL